MPEEIKAADQWCFAWDAVAPPISGKTRAVAPKASLWNPGDAITISFLDGDKKLKTLVEEAARQWVGPTMANLEFVFQKKTDTLIRISFKSRGSWSAIGTTCREVDKKKPTMNLGWLTSTTDQDEVNRVVLHEFGHALGLIHEHQHPKGKIDWNKKQVAADLAGPPQFWTPEQIQRNLFETFAAKLTNFSKFDKDSIMLYPIPAKWTNNGFATLANKKLSKTDADFIRTLYPW
ncbi:MAG: hypothetical protein K7J46_19935 [Bryobacter sp.]|jgi:serralysin|nr:hypothetical protein [Bryobacter sp. CoA8 C33]